MAFPTTHVNGEIVDATWANDIENRAAGAITTVLADPAVPDGTTDNTSYLAGRLTTALSLGATLRIPKGTNGNWVLNKLVLSSNTSVDATGATFVQASGTNTRLILNTSLTLGTPGSARDSNISWTGGTFVKGTGQTNVGQLSGTGLEDHCSMFGFVDGLILKNVTFNQSGTGGNAGTGGRYGCYVWNCTGFSIENYSATSASQAVNQSTLQIAYSQNGHVKGVYGSYGDDAVALVNGNATGDLLANGLSHTENVTVEDVLATAQSNGVRIMAGSTAGAAPFYNVQHCTIRNVRGTFAARNAATNAAIFAGGTSNSGTYPNLQNGTIQDVNCEDIVQLRASSLAAYIEDWAEVWIAFSRINNQQDSTMLNMPAASNGHARAKVKDCVFTTAITSGTYYPIAVARNNCRSLELENIQLQAATTGTATVGLVNGTLGPGWLVATNIRTTGKCYALGTFASTTRIVAYGINGEDANGLGHFQTTTGGVVTVRGWNGVFSGGVNGFVQTAGSVATNDSRLQGASGTVALVAGTATVSSTGTGMVTATSQIRLTTLASGGTVGHCYVSARSAGSFTITSTSGSDTSTIFWEVVNS